MYIATAANLQHCMTEIIDSFESKYGITCELITASSGKLTAQILEGAPYDVFLSADSKYTNLIHKSIPSSKPFAIAIGSLVLTSSKAKSKKELWELLYHPNTKIAIPNPALAPYGELARCYLKQEGLYEKVQKQLIYGESVAQTNQFIHSKSVDLGFTSLSSVLAPEVRKKNVWVSLFDLKCKQLEHSAITISQKEKDPKSATDFTQFLSGFSAQNILKKHGYLIPKKEIIFESIK